jgi:NAD(P)H dehydrogenase (quinone)
MNVLIVYAHSEPQSFSGALKDTAVEVLSGAGHNVQVSDLYATKFDPAGGPDDFMEREDPSCFRYRRKQIHAHKNGSFTPELAAEMAKLLWADLVIFQFPLWWFSLPAILKGRVDRVFAMGFSYDLGRAYETGFFPQKKGMLALTKGGPAAAYSPQGKNGEMQDVLLQINRGMLHFLGLQVLPRLSPTPLPALNRTAGRISGGASGAAAHAGIDGAAAILEFECRGREQACDQQNSKLGVQLHAAQPSVMQSVHRVLPVD